MTEFWCKYIWEILMDLHQSEPATEFGVNFIGRGCKS